MNLRKVLVVSVVFLSASVMFAQSSEYAPLLKKGKEYEAKKQYVYALGTYYDAMEAAPLEAKEAFERFQKLGLILESGKPGEGEFNEFDLYDEWVRILKEKEKYWCENCPLKFVFLKPKRMSTDMKKRTANYTIGLEEHQNLKASKISGIINTGYYKAKKDSWELKLPLYENTFKSDAEKDGIPIVYKSRNYYTNGVDWTDRYVKLASDDIDYTFHNRYGLETLYVIAIDICDKSGKVLYSFKDKTNNESYEYYIKDVPQELMPLFDSNEIKIVPKKVGYYYGFDVETPKSKVREIAKFHNFDIKKLNFCVPPNNSDNFPNYWTGWDYDAIAAVRVGASDFPRKDELLKAKTLSIIAEQWFNENASAFTGVIKLDGLPNNLGEDYSWLYKLDKTDKTNKAYFISNEAGKQKVLAVIDMDLATPLEQKKSELESKLLFNYIKDAKQVKVDIKKALELLKIGEINTDLKIIGSATSEEIFSLGKNFSSKIALDLSDVTGVKEIKDKAFYVTPITDIILPNTLEKIGVKSFSGCRQLTRVKIPSNVNEIGEEVFRDCDSLTHIELSNKLSAIGSRAFAYCKVLNDISLPKNLKNIKRETFVGCESLENIEIPYGVEEIELNAFANCKSLTNITIPVSVKKIGNGAFQGCTSLKTVSYGGTESQWNSLEINYTNNSLKKSKVIYTSDKVAISKDLSSNTKTNEATKNTQNSIKNNNVVNVNNLCEYLSKLKAPASIKVIGDISDWMYGDLVDTECDYKFSLDVTELKGLKTLDILLAHENLTEIKLPASLSEVETSSLYTYCKNLEKFEIVTDNKNFMTVDGVLYSKDGKTLVAYPSGRKDKQFSVPNTVTKIESWALANRFLNSVAIPASVTNIDSDWYSVDYDDENLKTIKYDGTKEDWNKIASNVNLPDRTVVECSKKSSQKSSTTTAASKPVETAIVRRSTSSENASATSTPTTSQRKVEPPSSTESSATTKTASSRSSPVKVTSAWNFEKGEKASKNAVILGFSSDMKTMPSSNITLRSDSGSGAQLVFIAQNKIGFKYNKGLQLNATSNLKESDFAKITVENDCTLVVTGKGSTGKDSFDSSKKRNSFSVNGKQIYMRTKAEETSNQTWRIPLKKGENVISATGMRFISFVCE